MRHSVKETNFFFSRLGKENKVFLFLFEISCPKGKKSQKRKKRKTFFKWNVSQQCDPLSFSFILSFPPTLTLKDHSVNNIKGTTSQFFKIKTQMIKTVFNFFKMLKPSKIVLWHFKWWVLARGLGCYESLNIFVTTFFGL